MAGQAVQFLDRFALTSRTVLKIDTTNCTMSKDIAYRSRWKR